MTENTKPNPKPAPKRWGLDGDRVLEKLQGKMVLLRLADGTLTGQLVGYSEYTLTLRCTDGVKVVGKGFVGIVELWKGANGAVAALG